jgi:cell division protease FtsH
LVLELLDKETLDKEQVARIFEPLRRRPQRPAWTGSPDRVPSSIPPVEIPQEIRDRANGVPSPAAPAEPAVVGAPVAEVAPSANEVDGPSGGPTPPGPQAP